MIQRIFIFFSLFIFVFASTGFQPLDRMPEKKLKTKYVVVLVIDGPRFSETFGDSTCQYIPKLGRILKNEGSFYSDFQNNGPTYTISGHTAMTTGVYQQISNTGKHLPKSPSMFQYFLKSKKVDKSEAWIIASKGKLEVLANTKSKKWWSLYMPSTYCGAKGNGADYVSDAQTFEKAKAVFAQNTPTLTLINLLAVDAIAHQNDWNGYLEALKKCDDYAFQIWNEIQSNPEMKNQTTLFITNDHGRHLDGHKDGFKSHGDKCEGCKHISLLVLGPDVKKNRIIEQAAELIDISKTISVLLNFDMPTAKGRYLEELFL
jgi:predicted AlkP superfamily pyrophosphatase or phosphodiesterase